MKQQDKILDKISEILVVQEKILDVQQKMQKEQEKMREQQEKMQEEQQEMKKEQQEMKKEQLTMKEELTRVGNTVTRIEYEHGRKIDLILEVLTGHTEKFEENEKRYKKDQKVIEMYGHKIYALEQQKEK